ncbi:MAG: TetR/AcrR family transcriptional regulator [Actinomycetota bacterium]
MTAVKGSSRTRSQRAQETRARMLRSAYELFTERGYPATTMADVAKRAGVAVQTVHFTFGTKGALLQHAYDYAVLGEGNQVPPDQQPWYTEFRSATEPRTALKILVENVSTVMSRSAPLDDFVRSASYEPDAARIRNHAEMMRRQAWSAMVEHLSATFGLADDLTTQQAVDILMLLMSPTSYNTLTGEYNWSPAEWQTWCVASISGQLLARHLP